MSDSDDGHSIKIENHVQAESSASIPEDSPFKTASIHGESNLNKNAKVHGESFSL